MGAVIVGFAKDASYCGLIFVDKRHTMKSMKFSMFTYISTIYIVCCIYLCVILEYFSMFGSTFSFSTTKVKYTSV